MLVIFFLNDTKVRGRKGGREEYEQNALYEILNKNIKRINGGHVSKVLVVEWKRQNCPLERFRDQ